MVKAWLFLTIAATMSAVLPLMYHQNVTGNAGGSIRGISTAAMAFNEKLVIFGRFGLRGRYWLEESLNLILTANAPITNEILIHPISPNMTCNASKLDIWVRVSGSEILAGSAIPDAHTCTWRFPLKSIKVGVYLVEIKILLYNGRANVHPNDCKYEVIQKKVAFTYFPSNLQHEGFTGSKFYNSRYACCEICTRSPGCVMWKHPTLDGRDGCELFYRPSGTVTTTNELPPSSSANRDKALRNKNPSFGWPRVDRDTAYYLGCGWSLYYSHDYPCKNPETDDMIATFNFTIYDNNINQTVDSLNLYDNNHISNQRRYCTPKDETLLLSQGRWVRGIYPTATQCPLVNVTVTNGYHISTLPFDPIRPTCWYRENLSLHGKSCAERGCDQWIKQAWISSLHLETQFYATWEPYSCQYKEINNSLLQQCFTQKKISNIEVKGLSVAIIVRDYLDMRVKGVYYYNESSSITSNTRSRVTTMVPVIHTLFMPHLLWHYSIEQFTTALYWLDNSTPLRPLFWVTGFYITSEREEHVHNGRSKWFTEIAEPILRKKGKI